MAEIYIVRHPEVVQVSSYIDLAPISNAGEDQIRLAAGALKRTFIDQRPDVFYTASSIRSKTTAQMLAGLNGWSMPIVQTSAFDHTMKDDLGNVMRDSNGLAKIRDIDEVWQGLEHWKYALGVNTTAVATMSKRAIEIFLQDEYNLDTVEINSQKGALNIPPGSLTAFTTGRRGQIQEVVYIGKNPAEIKV
ncbi:phosphoglycerate mutase family protein [Candidatus Saccharibacteria bacterium]|nr:phosphoglycerate mutase family protein [Candidatus Saccharibacteria bacterium]NCU41097.1 phosphoglycerate mutase family protein [Candidatus Saccharibacteria bacterium]